MKLLALALASCVVVVLAHNPVPYQPPAPDHNETLPVSADYVVKYNHTLLPGSAKAKAALDPSRIDYWRTAGPFRVGRNAPANPACTVWFPQGDVPAGGWPVLAYVCGTGGACWMYEPLLQNVASHGFVAVCNIMDITRLMPNTHACMRAIVAGGDALGVRVNPNRIATGGHSGGGPISFWAAGAYNQNVIGYVGHFAAAIPLFNRPTDQDFRNLNLNITAITMCGTLDVVPFCGCLTNEGEYFRRYNVNTPRILLRAPSQHITGVVGDSGLDQTGGHVTAFLAWMFRGETNARRALTSSMLGYSNIDLLG